MDVILSWQLFDDLSGQTVRLRIESNSDEAAQTSFHFDTLALTATHCP
jgi:hypothetical protein